MRETGIFYFNVIAANLVNWTINLDITPATSITTTPDDSSSNTSDDLSSSTTGGEKQTSESSTDEDANGFVGFFIVTGILTIFIIKSNNRKKT